MIVTALRGRLVLSLRHLRVPSCLAAVLSSRCLLTAPHFRCLVAPAGCCVAAGWLLRCLSSRRRLILSSRRRTLVLLLSSHCAALPLPRHASWLLRRLSSRRHTLVLSLSSHCAALSLPCQAGWLLPPLVAPPSCFLVAPPHSRPIVVLSLRCPLVASSLRRPRSRTGGPLLTTTSSLPLATCDGLGPEVGLLLGLSVRRERC